MSTDKKNNPSEKDSKSKPTSKSVEQSKIRTDNVKIGNANKPKPFERSTDNKPSTGPVKPLDKQPKQKSAFKACLLTGVLGIIIGSLSGIGGYWVAQEHLPLSEKTAEDYQTKLNSLRKDFERGLDRQQNAAKRGFETVSQQVQQLAMGLQSAQEQNSQNSSTDLSSLITQQPSVDAVELETLKKQMQQAQNEIEQLKRLVENTLNQLNQRPQNTVAPVAALSNDKLALEFSLLQLYLIQGQPYATLLDTIQNLDKLPNNTVALLEQYKDSGFDVQYQDFKMVLKKVEAAQQAKAAETQDNTVQNILGSFVKIRKADDTVDRRVYMKDIRRAYGAQDYQQVKSIAVSLNEKFPGNGSLEEWITQLNDFITVKQALNAAQRQVN